jgi:hypothetical protein
MWIYNDNHFDTVFIRHYKNQFTNNLDFILLGL